VKIAIIGCGAMGSVYAGLLASAGNEVLAVDRWTDHVAEASQFGLFNRADSWYLGANIPGKKRVFMPYVGGLANYRAKCEEIAASGYEGFLVSP